MTLIRELLNLPGSVRKGDFVQSLAAGINDPKQTVDSYAITPAILNSFRRAMEIIDSALKSKRSQAAYLHGSFGSGKSHFMALLDLMLKNDNAPWTRSEFHPLREQFEWIGKSKILQLPFNMQGAVSMEDQIFSGYVKWLEKTHPDASIPALYADLELFKNAVHTRKNMGDERFFEILNGNATKAKGWGKLGDKGHWDAASFDETLLSHDREKRERLFSDLVKTHFSAFQAQRGHFIDFDSGLAVMCRHAATLGYDCVVLYLDELILWLAGRASNLDFIAKESQKLVKLKEAQDEQRDIPLVSFIARQRDLAQLVGEHARGVERSVLEDNLNHNSGRFETVPLADSNLPAIVKHRVVRSRDAESEQILNDAFATLWRKAGKARATLIGSEGDEEAFRKVYPFSPTLVETLVALSDCLQRERTAIRLLMELLVEHMPELTTDKVVPVGDAFDAIAGGEDPFDQAMKDRFDRARKLYNERFLPLIRSAHKTDNAEQCQKMRPDHPVRLGCSRCEKKACRNDNRLAKTLLMASLVPQAAPFRDMTVSRLVHLNHGVVTTIIPGTEVSDTVQKLKKWASQIGDLKLGEEKDPTISLNLSKVDLNSIIVKAAEMDTHGQRKIALRRLLFEAMGLDSDVNTIEHSVYFRGVKRKGTIRYANVREMSDAKLRCPSGSEWYVVIDYPFDEGVHSPEDDLQRLQDFREKLGNEENPTVTWLPTFFSHELESELGEYVVIRHILSSDRGKYFGHLRIEDQISARKAMENLSNQKKNQILDALARAYGVSRLSSDTMLDNSRAVEEHFISLMPGHTIPALLAGRLSDGLQQLIEQVLERRYPHHPKFDGRLSSGKLDRVRLLVENIMEAKDHRRPIDKGERKELLSFADPLGLTQTQENVALLHVDHFRQIKQRLAQAGNKTPNVSEMREIIDPNGHRGFPSEVSDLLIWLYAHWDGRSIEDSGKILSSVKLGKLSEEALIVLPDLPTLSHWTTAIERAGRLFGLTASRSHLSAGNVADFDKRLKEALDKLGDVKHFANLLKGLKEEWAPEVEAPRLKTAESAARLIDALEGSAGSGRVQVLAEANLETSETAVSKSLAQTKTLLSVISNDSRWIGFKVVRGWLNEPAFGERARHILEDLAAALCHDEINMKLGEELSSLTKRVAALQEDHEKIRPVDPPPPPPPAPKKAGWKSIAGEKFVIEPGEDVKAKLIELAERLQDKGSDCRFEIEVRIDKREDAS